MLFAGFDAGQTRTRCRISRWTTDSWMTVCEGQAQGVSHLDAQTVNSVVPTRCRTAFQAALGQRDAMELDAAVIGASGIEQGTTLQQRAGDLIAQELVMQPDRVLATGDERTALRGAFPDSAGIVLISGTGMICVGRNAGVRTSLRAVGVGCWMALAPPLISAIRAAAQLQMADGRLSRTIHSDNGSGSQLGTAAAPPSRPWWSAGVRPAGSLLSLLWWWQLPLRDWTLPTSSDAQPRSLAEASSRVLPQP